MGPVLRKDEGAEELERRALAAQMAGRDAESNDLLARAHLGFLAAGEVRRAARCAIWLSFRLAHSGEPAQASGWVARARRLLEGHAECAEHGLLLVAAGLRSFQEREANAALEAFQSAVAIGERHGDRDLVTMALHGQGRAAIRMGERDRGAGLLDEAMAAVMAGEVSAPVAGVVYCSVIESCSEILDLRRAFEWTSAFHQWCAAQPEQNGFRGACLLHRAEVLQLRGEWAEALTEARQACERLGDPVPKKALGNAHYCAAELHRLKGEFAEAEEAYRRANFHGRSPQPGLALLRLAQGQTDAASTAIRGAMSAVVDGVARAWVLSAAVEILLATGEVGAARSASAELEEVAGRHGAALLCGLSRSAAGAVSLAEGDSQEALRLLREAREIWRELAIPHEEARARVLIAKACRSQGDCDTGEMEMAAARRVFEELGAAPDLARMEPAPEAAGPLTEREVEVLKLIASGATNRVIARTLGISEKTVARHISNIFVKVDVSSRAAATAYAFRKNLV